MTYKELLQQLQQLNEEQLNQDVAVCDPDGEYFRVTGVHYANPAYNDILDAGHPYFTFD